MPYFSIVLLVTAGIVQCAGAIWAFLFPREGTGVDWTTLVVALVFGAILETLAVAKMLAERSRDEKPDPARSQFDEER